MTAYGQFLLALDSAAWLLRREAPTEVGNFDGEFFLIFEEKGYPDHGSRCSFAGDPSARTLSPEERARLSAGKTAHETGESPQSRELLLSSGYPF